MASGINRCEREPGGHAAERWRENVEGGLEDVTVQGHCKLVVQELRHGKGAEDMQRNGDQGHKGLDLGHGHELMYLVPA